MIPSLRFIIFIVFDTFLIVFDMMVRVLYVCGESFFLAYRLARFFFAKLQKSGHAKEHLLFGCFLTAAFPDCK